MVQVQADVLAGLAGGGGGGGLSAGELQLLNQVLVGQLGEAGALLGVQENVVNPHGHLGGGDGGGGGAGVVHVQAVDLGREGEVELDLVVLEGNQGQGQAGGLVEEEDQGHVETLDDGGGRVLGVLAVHEVGHTTVVHTVVVHAEQGVVSAEPVVVVLVNALATDLQLNILQQCLGGVESGAGASHVLGEHELNHDVSDQITVTGDLGGHLIPVSDRAIDGLLDRLNSEVSIVYTLPFGIFEGTRLYLKPHRDPSPFSR